MAVAVVAVSAGCSGGGDDGADGSAHRATLPAPGEVARRQAARDSVALLARYDAAAAEHPTLAARLAPLRAEVALHVSAFGGTAAPAPSASPSPAATPTGTKAAALTSLAAAERRLADRRAAALLDAPGELARLFASVAAAGAGHAALLTAKPSTKGAAR